MRAQVVGHHPVVLVIRLLGVAQHEAMRKAKSTDAKKVAFALEGMAYKSPMGEVRMRKSDHQLEAPLYLGMWAKQGSKGVKYDAENTGYGFRSEVAWDSYVSAQPTSCQMKRPS